MIKRTCRKNVKKKKVINYVITQKEKKKEIGVAKTMFT